MVDESRIGSHLSSNHQSLYLLAVVFLFLAGRERVLHLHCAPPPNRNTWCEYYKRNNSQGMTEQTPKHTQTRTPATHTRRDMDGKDRTGQDRKEKEKKEKRPQDKRRDKQLVVNNKVVQNSQEKTSQPSSTDPRCFLVLLTCWGRINRKGEESTRKEKERKGKEKRPYDKQLVITFWCSKGNPSCVHSFAYLLTCDCKERLICCVVIPRKRLCSNDQR